MAQEKSPFQEKKPQGSLTGTALFKKQGKVLISLENLLKIVVSLFIRDIGL